MENILAALFKNSEPKVTIAVVVFLTMALMPAEINPTLSTCIVNSQHSAEHMPKVLKNIGDLDAFRWFQHFEKISCKYG